jgi:hypothetical protein
MLDKKSKFFTGEKLDKDFYVNKMLYLTFDRYVALAIVCVRGLRLIKSLTTT